MQFKYKSWTYPPNFEEIWWKQLRYVWMDCMRRHIFQEESIAVYHIIRQVDAKNIASNWWGMSDHAHMFVDRDNKDTNWCE